MDAVRLMSFLLAGPKMVPHSPGSGRAFSWWRAFVASAAVLAATGCASLEPAGPPVAYVPNEGSGTISIVDTTTDTVTGEIRTGGKPRGLALSRDGRFIYVSDGPSNSLRIVDVAQRAVVASVALGKSPEGVSVSPDGRPGA